MENHNKQRKIAVINDMSGFGKCSITVELPIISAMGIQCCPLPTAIFSNHTGYESFFWEDYTDKMEAYQKEWEKLGLEFDGVCTGFLASRQQIQIVKQFLERFKKDKTIVVIDPVMGDYGELYPTYQRETGEELRKLLPFADILTPNLTEACVLTGTKYKEQMSEKEIIFLADELSKMGPEKIAITGIDRGEKIANLCYEKGKEPVFIESEKIGISRAGTGDIFCSMLAADAVNGVEFRTSVEKTTAFIKTCIKRTTELQIPEQDGVCFEEFLGMLAQ
ncbi:MAG: pyridoxamine kinase [Roseburia sp.]